MEHTTLTDFYDDLKSKLDNDREEINKPLTNVHDPIGATAWRNKAVHFRDHLKDKCCKHLILDIYCKILPLDKDYIDGNMGQMKADVDSMLSQKNMSPTQYMTSCYEATNAPLVEYMIRSADTISRVWMEEATEKLKDAQENDIDLPDPVEPETDDEEIEGQLVDVKSDTEYETFVDMLKKKTIDKIVADVSKIISSEKEKSDMTFNTEPTDDGAMEESVVAVSMDYMTKKFMESHINLPNDDMENIIGMAIREAALHELDVVFNQPTKQFREFATRIRLGKGAVVNESAVNYIKESFSGSAN